MQLLKTLGLILKAPIEKPACLSKRLLAARN
jgi:hypothetical protein